MNCSKLIILVFTLVFISCSNSGKEPENKSNSTSNINQGVKITQLLKASNNDQLTPESVNNLNILQGFRGVKLNTPINYFLINDFTESEFYGMSNFGKWEKWNSEYGFISYTADIGHDKVLELNGTQISTIRLTFIDDLLAEITLFIKLYEISNDFFSVDKLKQTEFENFYSSLVRAFCEPTSNYTNTLVNYHDLGATKEPIVHQQQVRVNEWSTNKVKLSLKHTLPNKKVVEKNTYVLPGSVQVTYTSTDFIAELKSIDNKLQESIKRRAIEENRKNYIGEF